MRFQRIAAACLLAWCVPACVAEAPDAERAGSMQLPIVSTSAIGHQYRLTGTLQITGPDPTTVSAGGDAASVSVPLRVGSYTLALAAGWQVERFDGGMPIPVQATLATATPVAFSIQEGVVTPVSLAFQLQGDSVVFGTGTLDVTFQVDDDSFETSCSDGTDNDADGMVDCLDPECAGASECAAPVEQCSNGVDDDGNGLVDCMDPACSAQPACHVPACGDGLAEAGEYCFGASQVIGPPIGGQIAFITTADFNGDGATDIAIASSSPANVIVLFRSGATFTSGPVFSTGGTLVALKVADLDANGRPDLVVANSGNSSVRGLNVDPMGVISNLAGFNANVMAPRTIELADFNGDVRPDLFVGTDSQVLAFRNNGNFSQTSSAAFAGPMGAMVSADFDGDGRPELAAARTGGSDVRLFEADTSGLLTATAVFPVAGMTVDTMAVVDADANGSPDIVTGNSLGQGSMLLNMGGSFGVSFGIPLPPVSRLAVGDLDFDNRADLLGGGVSHYFTATGNGAGSFVLREDLPGGAMSTPVRIADVTGDGFGDIIVGKGSTLEIRPSTP